MKLIRGESDPGPPATTSTIPARFVSSPLPPAPDVARNQRVRVQGGAENVTRLKSQQGYDGSRLPASR